MGESYSVKATLSAKDSGFSSTLKNATSNLKSLANEVKSGIGFGVLTGIGQSCFSALSSGIQGLVGDISSMSVSWKNFASNMSILGKGSAEIDAVKQDLQEFAQQTVYSSSDMATTYAQLAAVGVKDTGSLVKAFGGLAAASENPQQAMKTLSQQATQMAAKPEVAWADFKLMLEQTPAGIAAVAKEMGMSTSQLVTAVQEGEVSTNKFFKAITKAGGAGTKFAEMATEFKTVGQAVDGLKDSIGFKLTPAFDALSAAGIDAVNGIASCFDKIDGEALASKIKGLVADVKKYWGALKESFAGVGTDVWDAVKEVGAALGWMGGEFGSTESVDGFKDTMKGVADLIKSVAGFVKDHAQEIATLIKWLPKIVIGIKGFQIARTVVPGVVSFAKGIGNIASKVGGGIAAKLFGFSRSQKEVGKTSVTSGKQMLAAAGGYALMGVAVLAIAAGFALLAFSAIALANAGGGAIGVMAGLVVVLVGLGIGMAALMKSLAPMSGQLVAVGVAFLAMGAAVMLISVGFMLMAQASIALAAAGWGAIGVMIGMVAAIALLAVGAALLGTALTAGAVGFVAFGAAVLLVGAGFLLLGVGALIAVTALQMFVTVLPLLTAVSLQGMFALVQLGIGLTVFGAGALLAGLACIVLAAGLALVGVAVLVLAAGVLVLSAALVVAAGSLALMGLVMPQINAHGMQCAATVAMLGLGLLALGVSAAVAAIAVIALGAGFLAASIGILLCAAGMAVLAAAVLTIGTFSAIAAASFSLMASVIPKATANALKNSIAMGVLAGGLIVIGAAALVAGAGFVVLGAGLLVTSAGIAAVALGVTLLGVAIIVLSAAAAVASGAIALLNLVLPTLAATGAQSAAGLAVLGAALIALGAGAIVAGAGTLVFGAAMIVAAAGTLVMLAAIAGVSASMKAIASDAKRAESSLKSMQSSVDAVQSGLSGLGSKAKSAMKKLTSAFDSTANDVKSAGKKVGDGFNKGMQGGLKQAPATAMMAIVLVNTAFMSGYGNAYAAGAYISQGFAAGMLSCLGTIQSAAARMAAAADKAIRAKAKIHSPSKVSAGLGAFWGEGFANGINSASKDVKDAAESIVFIPALAAPRFAMAYDGEMSSEYGYYRNSDYTIEVPLTVDGKEFARATATYTQEELDKRQLRDRRKQGKV